MHYRGGKRELYVKSKVKNLVLNQTFVIYTLTKFCELKGHYINDQLYSFIDVSYYGYIHVFILQLPSRSFVDFISFLLLVVVLDYEVFVTCLKNIVYTC